MSDLFFSNTPPSLVLWQLGSDDTSGPLLLGFTKDKKLCRVSFLEKRKAAAVLKEWKREWPTTTFTEGVKPQRLKPTTPLLLIGTDFQHRVWAALLDIPEGETLTYGELAARIGKPKAARAVGTALGLNPIPLIVPCHRVVSSTGIGGFSSNLAIKRALLNHEAMAAFKV